MKHWPLRVKLTLAYTLLTAVTGAGLLGLVMLLSDPVFPAATTTMDAVSGLPVALPPSDSLDIRGTVSSSLLETGAIALVIVVAVAAVLGWFTARRALRPVRSVTAAAQQAAGHDLSTRIRMLGPSDEIKELADTFDHMLTRLERSFESQRRFVANAAHELKTPVAAQRTVIEVAIARPGTDAGTVSLGHKLLTGLDHQERVLTGLLALAQNTETVGKKDLVDLADLVRGQLGHTADHLELRTHLDTAEVRGDAVLLQQLVRNLVDNASVHNEQNGWVSVRTRQAGPECALEISNSGPRIDHSDADALFEPFQRLCFDRADPPPGSGLGLSVVRAIAEAHDGSATADPRAEGGLTVRVTLPAAP
ncbi:sensor histidine kinase [Amycolatopsis sp. CA-230715]|uniref:sensor histidine kinase n=1 Tax=Amycolatopsis sp. CA-230715 TaxID=2745196 RepID=UPI001C02E128|nr:HAMP domain-containing sensor histidine kinase [Amycolatopsis sp. CA-230715]QWF82731.1 Sensor kinase CusS [Amycolatopsis sp. CA-230715]